VNEISTEEFIAITKTTPEQRLDYSLTKMIELNSLWGLYGTNGWLLLKADDEACFPIWPHEAFAVAWEKEEFPDCKPKKISFDDWQNQWLGGMKQNGTLILVFPLSDDEEGIMLSAEELIDCLQEELDTK
jgi:hypothetical protein